jgi:hypothetical protein
MYPLLIQAIAADNIRERHERAAQARIARDIRRRARENGPVRRTTGWARGPLTLVKATGATQPM